MTAFDWDAIRKAELHLVESHPIGVLAEPHAGPAVGEQEFFT